MKNQLSDAERAQRAEFKRFMHKFGVKEGTRLFLAGADFEKTCQDRFAEKHYYNGLGSLGKFAAGIVLPK